MEKESTEHYKGYDIVTFKTSSEYIFKIFKQGVPLSEPKFNVPIDTVDVMPYTDEYTQTLKDYIDANLPDETVK